MSILLIIGTAVLYMVAYHTYGRFLARKIFRINAEATTPAHTLQDDRDFVPTRRAILFGHHYTSIAGTGPIVGPAIAIIWGWVPALIWVLVGSIFMGAVHDFAALVISARKDGRSISDLTGDLISPAVRLMFLVLVFIALLIVLAIFVLVIATLFTLYPQSVAPVWLQIPIAMVLGWLLYKKQANALLWSLVALVLLYATVVLGAFLPITMPDFLGIPALIWWAVLLYIYAYIASTLPVWRLLQPRDYINSHQLVVAMGFLAIGAFVTQPEIVAPAVNLTPVGAPPILPFLFITIACGAISGFHSLVGSGTSSKQLDNEKDAQAIGYGSMLLEGMLAVLVIVAAGAGLGLHYESHGQVFTGVAAFQQHYASWGAAQGLGAKVGAFVQGSANMIEGLGVPMNVALAMMGMFVASFAGTTLDTATRIQRYIVSEVATSANFKPLQGAYSATAFAVITGLILALWPISDPNTGHLIYGRGGLILWPLFGASNQLLAALGLTVATVYLVKRKVNGIYTAIPAVIMVVLSAWAMIHNLQNYFTTGKWHLVVIGIVLVVVEIAIVFGAVKAISKDR